MILLFLFAVSPKVAYISSELLEMHAYDTYSEFAEQNKYKLQTMRPTYSAIQYMPRARNMYEVFVQIAEDEKKHAGDMQNMKSMDYI
jgi:ubiquinol oxidase